MKFGEFKKIINSMDVPEDADITLLNMVKTASDENIYFNWEKGGDFACQNLSIDNGWLRKKTAVHPVFESIFNTTFGGVVNEHKKAG